MMQSCPESPEERGQRPTKAAVEASTRLHPLTPGQRAVLARAQQKVADLEAVRQTLCGYVGDRCDCKYGRGDGSSYSEKTGCPEIRAAQRMIAELADERNELSDENDRLMATIRGLTT